jgi:hypothetical protein
MHTTKNTNAVVKVGRRMCGTWLFEDHDLSLLSTKHVALHSSYNVEITHHKHTIQYKHNQTRQTNEKGWFNILDLLRYCDKRDMAKGLWIARYGF